MPDDAKPPMSEAERLLRQCRLWLGVLAEACDADPEETFIRVTIQGEGPRVGEEVAKLALVTTQADLDAYLRTLGS